MTFQARACEFISTRLPPQTNHPSLYQPLRQISSLAAILFLFLCLPLHTYSQLFSQQKKNKIVTPITNEFVEHGLRKHREALRDSPEFTEKNESTHLRLAAILSQHGDPNGAIEEYHAALRLNPKSAKTYRSLGTVFIDKHEWRKAVQALQNGTALNAQDHLAFYWLGRSLLAQGHFSQAQTALTRATQLEAKNPEFQSDLALTLMAQGLIQEAEKALKKAIRLQPDLAEAHHRLEQVKAADANPHELIQSTKQILNTLFRRE